MKVRELTAADQVRAGARWALQTLLERAEKDYADADKSVVDAMELHCTIESIKARIVKYDRMGYTHQWLKKAVEDLREEISRFE